MCAHYLCYDIMGYIWDNLVVGVRISGIHVSMIEGLVYEVEIIQFGMIEVGCFQFILWEYHFIVKSINAL